MHALVRLHYILQKNNKNDTHVRFSRRVSDWQRVRRLETGERRHHGAGEFVVHAADAHLLSVRSRPVAVRSVGVRGISVVVRHVSDERVARVVIEIRRGIRVVERRVQRLDF